MHNYGNDFIKENCSKLDLHVIKRRTMVGIVVV